MKDGGLFVFALVFFFVSLGWLLYNIFFYSGSGRIVFVVWSGIMILLFGVGSFAALCDWKRWFSKEQKSGF